MKKDNNSIYFKDWTTKKLKQEARSYDQQIYTIECYSIKDLKTFNGIVLELEKRGIGLTKRINFTN